MAYPAYIREKARQLRRDKQLTIDELAERMALSRTTIYYWVQDLPLERRTHRQALAQRRASRSNRIRFRRKRDEAYELGSWEFQRLATDPTFRDFVCLYIAEGYKRCRNTVSLANSDPAVIKLANRWICSFAVNPVRYTVQYHADQNLNELRGFWSAELHVRPSDIKFQRKSNSGQMRWRVWRCRYGVLSVTASRAFRYGVGYAVSRTAPGMD
jgi:hypothetical protein